ncbi:spore coat U domain-containing protein [Rhodobacteraceae bacterium D3-12]|nr:spore coat U domain-containing protein [Rhodobacteraceae bacterium D3-12]
MIRRGGTSLRLAFLALASWLLLASASAAATCSASVSDINFGNVSVRAGAVNQTSGVITVTCTGILAPLTGACISFGPGSGGAGGGNSPRYMRRGDNAALAYQLRPLGNGGTFGTLNHMFVKPPLTGGTISVPFYADITSQSVGVGTGSYSSTFSGTNNISLTYGVLACGLLGATVPVPPFTVSAEVVPSCEIDVTTLSFGYISSSLNSPIDESATVNVRCTSDTAYSVRMGMGTGPGVTNPAMRKMSSGGNTLAYGLYRDSARSLVWGDTSTTDVDANGLGSNQAFTVYGRIHAGQSPPPGSYSDSVVVTVNY